jgi:predicted transcriptional regulator
MFLSFLKAHYVWSSLYAATFILLFIYMAFIRIDFSDTFKRRHRVLTMGAGGAVWEWFLFPIINKIIFIFTPKFYRQQIIQGLKFELKESHKTKVKDLEQQNKLLENEIAKLHGMWDNRHEDSEENYWKGVKYGYSLAQKNGAKETHSGSKKLTESHIFTLKQIANGNKSVNGLIGAYLEDRGYVKLIWENKGKQKHHYEITENGTKFLAKINGQIQVKGHWWDYEA